MATTDIGRIITQSNQRTLEASWTAQEALAWALAQETWPVRRWRVTGAAGTTTRLLTKKAAERAAARFGGPVVELIPTEATARPAKSKNQRLAADLPACPKCLAEAGASCLDPHGKRRAPHQQRTKLADLMALSKGLGPCRRQLCPAKAGAVCRETNGDPRKPHKGRAEASPELVLETPAPTDWAALAADPRTES